MVATLRLSKLQCSVQVHGSQNPCTFQRPSLQAQHATGPGANSPNNSMQRQLPNRWSSATSRIRLVLQCNGYQHAVPPNPHFPCNLATMEKAQHTMCGTAHTMLHKNSSTTRTETITSNTTRCCRHVRAPQHQQLCTANTQWKQLLLGTASAAQQQQQQGPTAPCLRAPAATWPALTL